jgi:hypothetical protein
MSNYEVSVSPEHCVEPLLTSVQVTLADQQLDPNSPLFSIKTFEELGL